MKIAILTLVAFLAVSSEAGPGFGYVDRKMLIMRLEYFRSATNLSINRIRSLAKIENPIVGGKVARQLSLVQSQVNTILGKLKSDIGRMGILLTDEQIRTAFENIAGAVSGGQIAIQSDVSLLSETTQNAIKNQFASVVENAETTGEEMIALLNQ